MRYVRLSQHNAESSPIDPLLASRTNIYRAIKLEAASMACWKQHLKILVADAFQETLGDRGGESPQEILCRPARLLCWRAQNHYFLTRFF